MFGIENRTHTNNFVNMNIKDLTKNLCCVPYLIYQIDDKNNTYKHTTYSKTGIPIHKPILSQLKNDHKEYMFTWFTLSFILFIMLGSLARKPYNVKKSIAFRQELKK